MTEPLTGDAAPCSHLCYCERGANRAEIARLQEAKRMSGLIADERSKENVALRAIVDELRTAEGIQKRDAEIARLRATLEDARHYAAVCPVPAELTGPARIEMLELRHRIGMAGAHEQGGSKDGD